LAKIFIGLAKNGRRLLLALCKKEDNAAKSWNYVKKGLGKHRSAAISRGASSFQELAVKRPLKNSFRG